MTNLKIVGAYIATALWPSVVLAQTQPPTTVPGHITSLAGFYGIFCNAVNWVFAFIMVLAVIAILMSALRFMTAGGSDEGVASARRYFIYALVGVAVAVLARSFVLTSGNYLGADISSAVACF